MDMDWARHQVVTLARPAWNPKLHPRGPGGEFIQLLEAREGESWNTEFSGELGQDPGHGHVPGSVEIVPGIATPRTNLELAALTEYTHGDATYTNYHLRKGKFPRDEHYTSGDMKGETGLTVDEQVAVMDSMADRGRIARKSTLYRGTAPEHFDGYEVGDEWTDVGFMSATDDPGTAGPDEAFNDGMTVKLTVPIGIHAISGDPSYGEVIFARHTTWRITKKSDDEIEMVAVRQA